MRQDLRRAPQARDPGVRHHCSGAPEESGARAGSEEVRSQMVGVPSRPGQGVIECDFFIVQTVWLKLCTSWRSSSLRSRRVFLTTSTAHPDSAWVTQQARDLSMEPEDRTPALRFLIRDRDSKFSGSFDEVFRSEGT
jgi:hypothetical protein